MAAMARLGVLHKGVLLWKELELYSLVDAMHFQSIDRLEVFHTRPLLMVSID